MAIQTATNPQTGETVVLVNGQWVPSGQTATNDQGKKAYLVNNQWLTDEPVAAPVKEAGFSLGDIAKSFGIGAVGSTKALTDVAGADNFVSSKLSKGVEGLQESMTPERQAEMQRQAARMKAAEKSGSTWEEIKAGALNVAEAPLQSAAQAVGSFVPYLPALFAAPVAAAMRLTAGSQSVIRAVAQQAPKIIGTAQGAGAVKGSIYDGVLRAEIEAGVDPETAKQKADSAQSYFGGNFDQIALGGGLGFVAGSKGVEELFSKAGRAGAAPGMARRVGESVLKESVPEGAQGGQEKLAENIALQRAGYDVDTFKGVAGAATQEALTGALGAAPIAALSKPDTTIAPKKEQDKFEQEKETFRKEFGEAKPVDFKEPEAPTEFPGGYVATRRELSRQDVPESYGIFPEGSDKPLTTVQTQEEGQAKLQTLSAIRAEEQSRLAAESEKISADINAEQRKLDVMEATGLTDTDQYVQAKAAYDQKAAEATQKIDEITQRIADYSAPLTLAPVGSRTDVQSDYVVKRGDQEIGAFPSPQDAELKLRELDPSTFKQVDQEVKVKTDERRQQLKQTLQPMLAKFGLADVGLNIVDRIENNAGGKYLDSLIDISLTEKEPIVTMRHEALHALKDLQFFTPQQYKALEERANKQWIKEYLQDQTAEIEVDGKPVQMSRLDAYKRLGYSQEAIVEEAIADAFGAYARGATPPPGMIAALFKKLKNFFMNFGQALRGAGFESADDVFQRVERGELKSRKPKAEAKTKEKLSLPVMRGEEVPKFEGPPKEGETEPTKLKPNVDSIGRYFDDQVMEQSGSKLDYTNKADFDRAVKLASEEVAYQIKKENSGLDWYEEDIKDAFKQTKKLIPELGKVDNRLLFSVMAGIMSPQTNARDNWFIAAKGFRHYVETGVVPGVNPETGGLWMGGTQSPNKKVQLDFLDKMVKDMGQKKALEWLFTDHTVKEINSFRSKYGNIKSGIGGKLTDVKPGLYAFGPKVGPFVSNLNGIPDVTVDKWMTRTFNRYFGTMVDAEGKIVDAPTEPQRRAIKTLINEVAKNAGIKPQQAQSLLWFYEQQLFTKIGVNSPSYGFSDGAKKFVDAGGGRGGKKGVSDAVEADEGKLSLRKGVVAEVAPNPDHISAKKWREMTPSERLNATKAVANRVVSSVFSELDLKGYKYEFSTGTYEGEVNPNIIVQAPDEASEQELDELARVLGYVLDQKAMVAFDEDNKSSGDQAGFVKVVIPTGMSTSDLNELRMHIGQLVPQADGDTLRDGALLYGNFSAYNDNVDTLTDKQYHKAILDAVESFPYDGVIRVSDPETFHSAFIWPDTRSDYLKETRYGDSGKIQGEAGADVRGQRSRRLQAISEDAISLRDKWIDARGASRLGGRERGAATDFGQPTEEYGKPTRESVSVVGVHFSAERRSTLISDFYGTGLRGLESERLNEKENSDIRSRIYFYVDNGKGVRPESGVGGTPHVIRLNNLYDAKADPLDIIKNTKGENSAERASKWERSVKKAGFDGYLVKDQAASQDYAVLIGKHSVKTGKLSLKTATLPALKQWAGNTTIVDGNGNPRAMYHGLAKDTTDFTRKTERGAPIFLTDDPKFAAGFAADSYESVAKNPEKYLTPEQIKSGVKRAIAAIRKDYGKDSFGKEMIESLKTGNLKEAMPEAREYMVKELVSLLPTGPHIMKLYVRAERPFDYENPNHIRKVLAGLTEGAYDFADIRSGSWEAIEGADFQDAIQDAGFDSFYVKEHGRKNLAVYGPNQVKSATGNAGTFSRTSNDVRYSLKNVAFPSAEEAKKAVAKTSVPKTDEFKQFIAGNQWVDEDGEPKVFYHATAREFFEFDPDLKVIYFSDTPEAAEPFGKIAEDRLRQEIYRALNKQEKLDFFQRVVDDAVKADKLSEAEASGFMRKADRKIPEYGDFGNIESEVSKALIDLSPTRMSIMPLYVRAETPFDFENKDHVAQVMNWVKQNVESKSEFADQKFNALQGSIVQGTPQAIESEGVQRALKRFGFDGYTVRKRGQQKSYAVYTSEQAKSVTGNLGEYSRESKNVKYSLPTIPQQITDRMGETTTKTQRKTVIQNIVDAIRPTSAADFRAKYLNRYNQMSVYDKKRAEQMGGAALLADQSAESAALMSDLGAGVAASAMGFDDRNGGIPVLRNGITTIDRRVKGLIASLAPLAQHGDPAVYQRYQYWAMVKRGQRLNANGTLTGIDSADVAFAKVLEQKHPEFVGVQKDLIAFNNGLVQYMVDTGVLSKERGHMYTKHADYIPFYRQMDGDETLGPNLFQSLSGVKPPKKLKGADVAEAPIADFLETMVRNTQSSIQAGIKNYAAQRALDVAVQVKAPGMGAQRLNFKSDAPDVINVLEKGNIVSYRTPDPLLVNAMMSLNQSELPFIGFLSAPADMLRNLVTKEPGFMMANMLRDSLSAWVTSGTKMTPIAGTVINFGKAIARKSPGFEALLDAGIIGGYEFNENIEKSGFKLEDDLAKKAGKKDPIYLRPFTSVWDALGKGTTASDAATRSLIYERVLEETGNEAEALYRSLEVMNFHRKGSSPLIRVLTAAVPFFNARLQGLDLFYRASTGNMNNKDAASIQRQFFVRGMTMMALSGLYWMMVSDDEEYKKQEQETKDNNWIIPAIGVKIPIPFEVGVLFKVIPERIMAYLFGNDTGQDLQKSVIRAAVSTFAFNPIPQTIKPVLEAVVDYNMFTMRPILGQGMKDIEPEFQVGPSTSNFSKALAQSLGLSPIKVDHIIKGYTGTIGMYAIDTIDMVMDQFGDSPKPTKRFEQLPVIKRFASDPEARGYVTQYYELKDAVDTTVRTMNLLEKTNQPEEYMDYIRKNQGTLAFKDYVNDTERALKELREIKVSIRASTMSGDEKRDALLSISQMESAITSNIQEIKKTIARYQ